MYRFVIALWLAYTFFCPLLAAQEDNTRFYRLSVENGLSQNSVNCTWQDRKGFMWFGTQDGLNRFDGYGFKIFKNNQKDPSTLSNNFVWSIFEDKTGALWIGTQDGLNCFDAEQHAFTKIYRHQPGNPGSLSSSRIYAISQDAQGFLWVGTESGISRLDIAKGSIKNYQTGSGEAGTVHALLYTKKGQLLAGTFGAGLQVYDPKTDRFVPYSDYPSDLQTDYVTSLYEDRKGNLWIGSVQGLRRMDALTRKVALYTHEEGNPASLSYNHVTAVSEDLQGNIWVSTLGGGVCWLIDSESHGRFVTHRHEIDDPTTLSHDLVRTLYTSRAGILWIGTNGGGLSVYDYGKDKFNVYRHHPVKDNSLSNSMVLALWEDRDGLLWIGTGGGGLNSFKRFRGQRNGEFAVYNRKNGLSDNYITAICESKDGKLWVGTRHGLNLFDKKTATALTYRSDPNDPESLSNEYITALCEDTSGILWVGTAEDGLNRMDPATKKFKTYKNNINSPNSLSDNAITAIIQSTDGTLWVATRGGGLNVFDPAAETFKVFKHKTEDANSLSSNIVNTIYQDKAGQLWIGSHGGLDRLNPRTGQFTNFNQHKGLAGNIVYGILEDEQGNLWISTNQGLSKFNSSTAVFQNYDSYDNLQSNQFAAGSCFKGRSGDMYFGGVNGFNIFNPLTIQTNKFIPEVVITDLRISHRSGEYIPGMAGEYTSMSVKELENEAPVVLPHEENTIVFDFVALNYRNADKNQYLYQLEGFDKTWIKAGTRRSASYTNLPAGEYTFRVKGSNNDGIWNEQGASVRLVIKPPYWETWWFKTLGIVLLVVLTGYVYQFRVNRIEKQKEKLEIQVRERTEEISQQRIKLQKSYDNVRIISEIGQRITSLLHSDLVIDTVFESISELMDTMRFRIGIYDRNANTIIFNGFRENTRIVPYVYDFETDRNHLSVWCIQNRKEIFINDLDKEYQRYSTKPFDPSIPDRVGSAIYLPLSVENEIIGLLTVQSHHSNAYTEEHLNILRTLAIYVSIALDNSITYGQLTRANEMIEAKNESILSSIRYAEKIQHAILPAEPLMKAALPEHFVIFKAKDIVSGDFYWLRQAENRKFLAVIDCTGHGVPGALMSMIGNTLLNEIVDQQHTYDPAAILEELHIGIRNALRQENNVNDDGMDIGLCMFEQLPSGQRVVFAGAKRPVFYVSGGILHEVKGCKKAIGGRQKEDQRVFVNVELPLQKGDMVYLSTDGFADQHNAERIKLGSKRLRELLQEFSLLPAGQQKQQLLESLALHQQETPQRDDITLIGIRV